MAGQEGMWQGGRSNKQTSTLADKLKVNNKIFLPLNSSGAMAEMKQAAGLYRAPSFPSLCFFPFLFGFVVRSGDGVLLECPLEHY